MKIRYYFLASDGENCYDIEYLRNSEDFADMSELKVYPAEIEYGTNYFWCSEFSEIGETGESCGKFCGKYSPRNGKNGRCKYHKNCYTQSDKPIFIKLRK